MADLTLTRRMREMLALVPNDWTAISTSPEDKTLKSLERRGLIELRIEPGIHPNQAFMQTMLGQNSHWQVRLKPRA